LSGHAIPKGQRHLDPLRPGAEATPDRACERRRSRHQYHHPDRRNRTEPAPRRRA
jgi:hypothetical protein